MTLHISNLFDPYALTASITDGLVREQHHPTLPLRILNYTERAQYERIWTDVTRQCRGLIIDAAGNIVARPFQKFFNYGEHPDGTFNLDARVAVTDKWDGSLGILYPTPDGHAIATRGSFTSDQAQHATKVWRERYAEDTEVDEDITWLFEIVYPANRIVCDYGDMDDLVLLGGVDIDTGRPVRPGSFTYDGPKTMTFGYNTLADALAAQPRPGAEGLVVRFPDHDHLMIKLKQDEYTRMHALVTGTSTRSIWELLAQGKALDELLEAVPDEFQAWVQDTAADLAKQHSEWVNAAESDFEIIGQLPDRKTFAERAVQSSYRAALFRLYDGREISSLAWKAVKPEYARPFQSGEEA